MQGLIKNKIIEQKGIRVLLYISLFLLLFWSLLDLSDFYDVVINKHGSNYPFGQLNENPWYYSSESLFWKYNLCIGLLSFFIFGITFYGISKQKLNLALIGAGLCLLLLLLHFFGANFSLPPQD